MSMIKGLSKKALLVILDGFGISQNTQKNAIKDAMTPNLDQLFKEYPYTTIEAGGTSVGLPKGVSGNSEVGHMNLGAGKPVRQDLVRINEAITNNEFRNLEKFQELISKAKTSTKRVHIMGLLSDGGVHSHLNHIKEVFNILGDHKDLTCFFHAFMDGRDTPKSKGAEYLKQIQNIPNCKIATIGGRSIGMDRDRRWDKIKTHYNTFIGLANTTTLSPIEYLNKEYEESRFDEFITPVLFDNTSKMQEGDVVFFINFRPDRAIQMTSAMNEPDFKEFDTPFKPYYFLCMTPYIPDELSLPILFDKEPVRGGLSEYLSSLNYSQFKIAETEKYAHVTFFFNGGEKKPFKNEKHILIPSPREVETYDLKPEMNAPLVTESLISALKEDYTFYLVNYANSDMVGHTGNYSAAVKAIEALDQCVKELLEVCKKENITLVLTADHGNSDEMVYSDGSPHTSHTGAPVPFCVFHPRLKNKTIINENKYFALKDVAPTILTILGIEIPNNFEGTSIF